MHLRHLSLDRLIARAGSTAAIVLLLPLGLYLAYTVSRSEDESLERGAQGIAAVLARQVAEPLLLQDRLALRDVLARTLGAQSNVRYLAIEDPKGKAVAHTFAGPCPPGLLRLWGDKHQPVVRYRSAQGRMLDVSASVLDGQLGRVHVGISRERMLKATRRVALAIGATLAGALALIFVVSHIVAATATQPLQRLASIISKLPGRGDVRVLRDVAGAQEVETLAQGFAAMADRLAALEQERKATQARMIRAERLAALGELAAGLAHEVQNPLDGMQGCLRLLNAEENKSERAERYYPMLQEGLERIGRVMREMLTFARSGREVNVEECKTADLVESLALLVQTQFEDKRVKLTWRQAGECVCMCDRHNLAQAVLNLVLNAAEAAAAGDAPEVLIEAQCDGEFVQIFVEDSGPGVPRDLRARVFEPFFTTKPMEKGTGLGLTVSREMIRAAGGELDLCSARGSLGGARFVIRLPKVPECSDGRTPRQNPDCRR